METLNLKTLSFPAKVFTRSLAALGIAMALVACGNKGGGGGGTTVVTPPIYGNGCTNCSGSIPNPVVLTNFQMQSANGNITFTNMNIVGQSSLIQSNASGNNFRNYVGPIAVNGQLVIAAQERDVNGGCVVPAGTYTVQTYTVGQMGYAGGDIVIPSLVTTSGAIEMRIDSPLDDMTGALLTDTGKRLYAKVTVVKVNGTVCSSTFYGTFN